MRTNHSLETRIINFNWKLPSLASSYLKEIHLDLKFLSNCRRVCVLSFGDQFMIRKSFQFGREGAIIVPVCSHWKEIESQRIGIKFVRDTEFKPKLIPPITNMDANPRA